MERGESGSSRGQSMGSSNSRGRSRCRISSSRLVVWKGFRDGRRSRGMPVDIMDNSSSHSTASRRSSLNKSNHSSSKTIRSRAA